MDQKLNPSEVGKLVIDNGLYPVVKEIALAPKELIREHLIRLYFAAAKWYINDGMTDPVEAEDCLYSMEMLITCLGKPEND